MAVQHSLVKCSCGTVIFQCRCPGPHALEIREKGCEGCRLDQESLESYHRFWEKRAYDNFKVFAVWLKEHFPCAWGESRERESRESESRVLALTQELLLSAYPEARAYDVPVSEVIETPMGTYY